MVVSRCLAEHALFLFAVMCCLQEACCTGIDAAITKEDALITSYRCHAWALVKGATIRSIFAELIGEEGREILCPCNQCLWLSCVVICREEYWCVQRQRRLHAHVPGELLRRKRHCRGSGQLKSAGGVVVDNDKTAWTSLYYLEEAAFVELLQEIYHTVQRKCCVVVTMIIQPDSLDEEWTVSLLPCNMIRGVKKYFLKVSARARARYPHFLFSFTTRLHHF